MKQHPSSFRDSSGYVFIEGNRLYRSVLPCYFSQFEHLDRSGLAQQLIQKNWLISHQVVQRDSQKIIIQPEYIPFISYPSEWSLTALREAALLHIHINIKALEHQMILKDASGYNIQFIGSRPIFIDTLSFDFYQEGKPWYAFGQFCRHFIAPLLLMKYCAADFNKVLSSFIDGIPLDLASNLLPFKTHFNFFIKSNIHFHSKAIKKNKVEKEIKREGYLSKKSLLNVLRYTQVFLENLQVGHFQSEWSEYYSVTNYSMMSFEIKEKLLCHWIQKIKADKIWDMGGNDGHFSRLISSDRSFIMTSDLDPIAINKSFLRNKQKGIDNILSLLIDITNPTPSFGFENKERSSFLERIQKLDLDCLLVLALIHHLCISSNCSFRMLAEMLAPLSKYLIIEFIDREDSWIQVLLDNMRDRRDLFDFYCKKNFENEFNNFFTLEKKEQITGSHRTLYLWKSSGVRN